MAEWHIYKNLNLRHTMEFGFVYMQHHWKGKKKICRYVGIYKNKNSKIKAAQITDYHMNLNE
jgi:hypothetical protein